MPVYVLHLDPAYKHARHYIGFTDRTPEERLKDHLTGQGSPLIKAALAAGCTVTIAHVWDAGTRTFERSVKNKRSVGRWCPLCAINTLRIPAIETAREAAE